MNVDKRALDTWDVYLLQEGRKVISEIYKQNPDLVKTIAQASLAEHKYYESGSDLLNSGFVYNFIKGEFVVASRDIWDNFQEKHGFVKAQRDNLLRVSDIFVKGLKEKAQIENVANVQCYLDHKIGKKPGEERFNFISIDQFAKTKKMLDFLHKIQEGQFKTTEEKEKIRRAKEEYLNSDTYKIDTLNKEIEELEKVKETLNKEIQEKQALVQKKLEKAANFVQSFISEKDRQEKRNKLE